MEYGLTHICGVTKPSAVFFLATLKFSYTATENVIKFCNLNINVLETA